MNSISRKLEPITARIGIVGPHSLVLVAGHEEAMIGGWRDSGGLVYGCRLQ